MKKIKIYILSILILTATSCSDFLEKYPDTGVPSMTAMTDLDTASEVVVGIYSSLKNPNLYSGPLTLLPDIQADLVYGVKGYSNTYGDVYRWEILSINEEITSIYAGLYQTISRCNYFLDHKNEVFATLTKEADIKTFNTRLGDVYFIRALAYSDLIRMFCEAYTKANSDIADMGISIYTSYENPGIQPRSTLEESYQFVLDDLARAEELTTREGSDAKYVTKAAVKALQARVYLYKRDWKNAADASQAVIDEDYLALANVNTKVYNSRGGVTTEYDLMFEEDTSDEIIFKVAFKGTDIGGALGTVFIHNEDRTTYKPDYVPAKWALDLYDSADKRYDTFFYQITTGYTHNLTWPMIIKYQGNPEFDEAAKKPVYTHMPKLFRLSEQYLIHAEACYQLANEGISKNINEQKASKDLTAIRRNRYSSYGTANYTGDRLLQEIKDERVRELYMEGFRLSDLKRWNDGFERIPQSETIEGALNNQKKVNATNALFTWPIPKHELTASKGVVKPNKSNN